MIDFQYLIRFFLFQQKHINETINIIPTSCHVSMKLTSREMEKYLEEIECNVMKPVCPLPASEIPQIKFTTNEVRRKIFAKRNSWDNFKHCLFIFRIKQNPMMIEIVKMDKHYR